MAVNGARKTAPRQPAEAHVAGARTYRLIERPDGFKVFKCLFCGIRSSKAENLERLYCARCRWFHEPIDEAREEFTGHLHCAVHAVSDALDLARAAVDPEAVHDLEAALRSLRKALSRGWNITAL